MLPNVWNSKNMIEYVWKKKLENYSFYMILQGSHADISKLAEKKV